MRGLRHIIYMAFIIKDQMSDIVIRYSQYLRNISGRSAKTVDEYCMDLRTLFRFIKMNRGLIHSDTEFKDIDVKDCDLEFIKTITNLDIFEFMNFVADARNNMSSTRQRKTSSIKGFFNYLCVHEKLLDSDPTETLVRPKKKKSLPKYLSLEQSIDLLKAVDGPFKERDYCMITLFLNCGLRLSELVGINIDSILRGNGTLVVKGKGNKERSVYLNKACLDAIDAYLKVRPIPEKRTERNALFLSSRKTRISPKTVQIIVNANLEKIGLGSGYSVHKLRHTAATLMYQYGEVDIRVLQDILGHENLSTTEIYTHISSKQRQNAIESNPLASVTSDKLKGK